MVCISSENVFLYRGKESWGRKKHEISNCLSKEEMSETKKILIICKVIILRQLFGKHRQFKDTAKRSLIAGKHKFRRMPGFCARVIENCSNLNVS